MSDDRDKTVRIRRNSTVGTDDRGRTVWTKPVEEVELELVSTAMLEQLLQSGDETQRERMRSLADLDDGVLAMDPTSREVEAISGDELASALRPADAPAVGTPATAAPGPRTSASTGGRAPAGSTAADDHQTAGDIEELSLVTTQMLRKILAGEDPDDAVADEPSPGRQSPTKSAGNKPKGGGGGYNPYDRG